MVWWLPLVAMAAQTYATNRANDKVEDDQKLRVALENQRQDSISKEVMARLRQELESQTRPQQEAKVAQAADVRERAYAPKDVATDSYVVNPSAPTEVRSEMASRMVDALQQGRQQAKALARLGGREDVGFGNQVSLTDSAADINMLGGFSRGSSGVLPYELQASHAKGKNWRTVADIARAVGTASMFYNMGTSGAGWTNTPNNPSYVGMHQEFSRPY